MLIVWYSSKTALGINSVNMYCNCVVASVFYCLVYSLLDLCADGGLFFAAMVWWNGV